MKKSLLFKCLSLTIFILIYHELALMAILEKSLKLINKCIVWKILPNYQSKQSELLAHYQQTPCRLETAGPDHHIMAGVC